MARPPRQAPRQPNSRRRAPLTLAGALAPAAIALALPAACLSLAASVLAEAPEPDPVPRRWQLDVEPGKLRMITVEVDEQPKSYFYFTYEVVNNSGEDLLFAPAFDLATNEGDIVRSGRDVPLSVTKQIMDMLDNPLLEDQVEAIDQLLQGPENAREGLIIWPVPAMDAEQISVYLAGFSGETKTITVPDSEESIILRKVLMIRYNTGGTLEGRGLKAIPEVERRWIMR
jgi:hypothetical protein